MNEPGKSLCERFGVLRGDDTRCFDCPVGYFFVSGFYELYGLTPEEIAIVEGKSSESR